VRRLLERFAARLADAAYILSPERLSAEQLQELRKELETADALIRKCSEQRDGLIRMTGSRHAYMEGIRALDAILVKLLRLWKSHQSYYPVFRRALADYTAAASFLHGEVRVRTIELDGHWIDHDSALLLAEIDLKRIAWPAFNRQQVEKYVLRLRRVAGVLQGFESKALPRDAPTLSEMGGLAGGDNLERIMRSCEDFCRYLLDVSKAQVAADQVVEAAKAL